MKFVRTLLNCCAGFQFYRGLISLHPLESIKFLAGVILVVVLVQFGAFVPILRQSVDEGATWVQANLPRFEIHKGRAQYNQPDPFVYSNEFSTIILDTSGQTNFTFRAPFGLWIGRDNLYMRVAPAENGRPAAKPLETRVPLNEYPDGVVDQEYIRQLGAAWLWRVIPYLVVVYFFGWMLATLVQAYIFTLVISLAESATLRKFGFNQFFNIAVHACAPAAVVATVLIVTRTYDFQWLLVAFLTTYFVYVMGATSACRREDDDEKNHDDLM